MEKLNNKSKQPEIEKPGTNIISSFVNWVKKPINALILTGSLAVGGLGTVALIDNYNSEKDEIRKAKAKQLELVTDMNSLIGEGNDHQVINYPNGGSFEITKNSDGSFYVVAKGQANNGEFLVAENGEITIASSKNHEGNLLFDPSSNGRYTDKVILENTVRDAVEQKQKENAGSQ